MWSFLKAIEYDLNYITSHPGPFDRIFAMSVSDWVGYIRSNPKVFVKKPDSGRIAAADKQHILDVSQSISIVAEQHESRHG